MKCWFRNIYRDRWLFNRCRNWWPGLRPACRKSAHTSNFGRPILSWRGKCVGACCIWKRCNTIEIWNGKMQHYRDLEWKNAILVWFGMKMQYSRDLGNAILSRFGKMQYYRDLEKCNTIVIWKVQYYRDLGKCNTLVIWEMQYYRDLGKCNTIVNWKSAILSWFGEMQYSRDLGKCNTIVIWKMQYYRDLEKRSTIVIWKNAWDRVVTGPIKNAEYKMTGPIKTLKKWVMRCLPLSKKRIGNSHTRNHPTLMKTLRLAPRYRRKIPTLKIDSENDPGENRSSDPSKKPWFLLTKVTRKCNFASFGGPLRDDTSGKNLLFKGICNLHRFCALLIKNGEIETCVEND